jgi:hypothetical protein
MDELRYIYGKANCHWGSPDGTVWAYEPSGFVVYGWEAVGAAVGAAGVGEVGRPVVIGSEPVVVDPLDTTPLPEVSFSGWQPVNLDGRGTRIVLEDRTAAVGEDAPTASPDLEEPTK